MLSSSFHINWRFPHWHLVIKKNQLRSNFLYTRVMCALNNETRSVYRGWLTKLHLGPAKKDTKRHTKHLVSVSMCYPRHLDGIPKKWPFSCQSPIYDLLLKSNWFDWRRVDQFNSETDCMNKIPNLMDSPEQFANVSHSTSHILWSFLDSFLILMISTYLGQERCVTQ